MEATINAVVAKSKAQGIPFLRQRVYKCATTRGIEAVTDSNHSHKPLETNVFKPPITKSDLPSNGGKKAVKNLTCPLPRALEALWTLSVASR